MSPVIESLPNFVYEKMHLKKRLLYHVTYTLLFSCYSNVVNYHRVFMIFIFTIILSSILLPRGNYKSNLKGVTRSPVFVRTLNKF